MNVNYIIESILGLWLAVLTGFIVWMFIFFKKLSRDVKKDNLIKILEKVLKDEEIHAVDITEIKKQLLSVKHDAQKHFQKHALIRFNPFDEMGGDQSFTLALLDEINTGFIITGLHTRERTRIYVKDIIRGKQKLDLSKEEEKVLKLALRE